MQVLTVDVGTGTQDIYLYDSRVDIENGFKLIMPSPTLMIHKRIRKATQAGINILLTGTIMGGGPSSWAAEDHIRAGYAVFATPDAARSFNDDLEAVAETGVQIVSEDEAQNLPSGVQRIELRDFDFAAISNAFTGFGVELDGLAAVAVAVFDHGNAPLDMSDRQFRFDYLDERIRAENRLSAFAYRAEQIPPIMTRLKAVAATASNIDAPLVVMDTAPAAVLGATFDPRLQARQRLLVANVGNFHTLAFRLGVHGIEGVFEHHTGLIDTPKLDRLLRSLADGSLQHSDVFGDHGHGALVYSGEPLEFAGDDFGVAVTGPRRNMLLSSRLRPYFPAPFGDMMITGCFGLLAATADLLPETREEICSSLARRGGSGTPPWEVD
ncbi:MAG: DUF1786 domain-containing protein [Anaerolineaceae bacterium]|jgi:uncharacterized protein (DUF1786 family)